MSLKSYVKAHAPRSFIPFIRGTYRAMMWPARRIELSHIISGAQKYLPYYQDELSREILSARLEYLRTGDKNIFLDLAEKTGMVFHSEPYGVYSGYSGIVLLHDNEGKDFRYSRRLLSSCDWSGKYRVITLREFLDGAKISDSELIVPVLTEKGKVKFEKALEGRSLHVYSGSVYSIREDLQYFDVFSPVDDEVVIDAGCYDGTTALQFLEWGEGKVKHIYSFEFDPENAAKCEENLKPYADKITLIKKGTWDKDEVLHVNPNGTSGSSIRSKGSTAVYLTSIDNAVKDERVTFIKMDVEGAELKSLMGARNTIIKDHPRMAICLYHKPEDLYEIPGYIMSLVPEYKFLLRHYSSLGWETVLYAYCD